MDLQKYALIVAGGKGTRMKSNVPKQFMELHGLPVLLRTLDAFYSYSEKIKIILVLPSDNFELWETICEKYNFNKPVILQVGGESRFQSVRNGLSKIEGDGLVAIHDGVRPLVSSATIASSFQLAAQHQSAIAAVPLKESIRIIESDHTRAMDRSKFQLIQTPQTFQIAAIKKAYMQREDVNFTDDATVAEKAGIPVFLFEGSYENIKITTSEDLLMAEALLRTKG